MKNLRSRFERFCFRNRNKGIPNLMLYVSLGAGLVYLMSEIAGNSTLYYLLCFDRTAILQGQIWRLITYPLTYSAGNVLLTLITLLCYYSLGRAMENVWGTFRFNLFYLTGIVLMDVFCLVFGGVATVYHLNLSLFLSYATMYPNSGFLLFFIIPVKAWIFALFDLVMMISDVVNMTLAGYFPYSLFPFVALLNYFLFFGKDVLNVIPVSWRANARRLFRKGKNTVQNKTQHTERPKVVPFPNAGSYEATVAKPQAPYTHRCTVCGRTDVSHPDLEFRYCSKCNGYYCYCEEHISNHTHIQ
mgnify:CR=1 FL=1